MANLKAIRKRITSVKSTQKITRAMKMVAGARLSRAQHRILSLRPYAIRTSAILSELVAASSDAETDHPLLAHRAEKHALVLLVTSDRGLCGAFNANTNKAAEAFRKRKEAEGVQVKFLTVGRRGHDFLRRRGVEVLENFSGVWEDLSIEQARRVARGLLGPFVRGEADSVYLLYNEFKSAMTQEIQELRLFPLASPTAGADPAEDAGYIFEPDRDAIVERLVPMYVEITLMRALYDSMASELGARMTAMDAATKNAAEMISKLTLRYNRERQAVITTELIEIIGGAEALHA